MWSVAAVCNGYKHSLMMSVRASAAYESQRLMAEPFWSDLRRHLPTTNIWLGLSPQANTRESTDIKSV